VREQLVVRHQALGIGDQITQDRERLAAQRKQGIPSPQTLVVDVDAERGK
jgi:hypothetical protein